MLNEEKEAQIVEPIVDPAETEVRTEGVDAKVSHGYLLLITANCFINCMQFGGVLSASGQNFTTLNVQLGWTEKDHREHVTLLSFICILGMCVGSSQAGKLFRFGKRRVVMTFQLVGITGSILSLAGLNFPCILVGRFLFGMSAGVFVSMCPVIIEHTVPGKYMDNGYGSSTNIAINLGVAVNMSLGLLIPLEEEELATSQMWRFIYGLPIVFLLIGFLINLLYLTNDTVKHHVEHGELEIAQEEMGRIYPEMTEAEIKNEVSAMQAEMAGETEDTEKIGICRAFSDVNYRSASWVCACLAVFMQFAGIDFVLVYATLLIRKLEKDAHSTSSLSPGLLSMIIGLFALAGPILSIKLYQMVGRKGIIVGGFVACGVFHLTTALLYINKSPMGCLFCMASFVLTWQMTIGSAYFVYISEVLVGSAMGMAVLIQLLSLLTITFLAPLVIERFPIDTIFYALAAGEIFPVCLLGYFMKETRGLGHKEKFDLYRKDCGHATEHVHEENVEPISNKENEEPMLNQDAEKADDQ